jgi:hypothetical protein
MVLKYGDKKNKEQHSYCLEFPHRRMCLTMHAKDASHQGRRGGCSKKEGPRILDLQS